MMALGALEPLASDVTAFDGDARRYVLFMQGSNLHVLDTLTEREYPARVPAGCIDTARRALSFPVVLLSCRARDVLVNVADRRVRPLPNTTPEHNWGNIGRVWVGPTQAANCSNFHVCQEYLDWHTGAVRRIDTPPASLETLGSNEVLARNLDSADLTPVAACPPFQPTNLDQSLVAYPRLYEPPYLIYGEAIEPFNGGLAQTARGSGSAIAKRPRRSPLTPAPGASKVSRENPGTRWAPESSAGTAPGMRPLRSTRFKRSAA